MPFQLSLESFLCRNRISQEIWDHSVCDWSLLLEIATDHELRLPDLRDTAEFFARVVQKLPDVHSVRWRVKDTEHLLEKIVRKRAACSEKYMAITLENYYETVTDLVGLRALHLFKDDCFSIDKSLRANWIPIEKPIAFVRSGDQDELTQQFKDCGFEIKEHSAGYRSIHYIFSSQPLQRKVVVEVQVRTIFEEGWSEIDHRVRYPNFSDNALVSYFLTIFNRLAGSADEMGGFVRGLATTLNEMQTQVWEANSEKEQSLRTMEDALSELGDMRQQDAASKDSIMKLKKEIQQLRALSVANLELIPGGTNQGGLLTDKFKMMHGNLGIARMLTLKAGDLDVTPDSTPPEDPASPGSGDLP